MSTIDVAALDAETLAALTELDENFDYLPDQDRVHWKTYRDPNHSDDPEVLAHRALFVDIAPHVLRNPPVKLDAFKRWKNRRVDVNGHVLGLADVWLATRTWEHEEIDLDQFDTIDERAASDAAWASPEAAKMVNEWLEADRRAAAYRPRRVGELLTASQPAWLVPNILPETGLALVFAESGAGKTFAALDLALAIVRGEPWLGERTRRGAVVYVGLEGRVQPRLRAYMSHHNLSVDDVQGFLALERAPINLVDRNPQRIQDLIRGIQLAIDEECDGTVRLVVIDTLARAMSGGDENQGEDMGLALANAEAISKAFGCLTMLVHHSGKDQSRGARGHSSLRAATDVEIEITRDGPSRYLKITKLRDGEDGRSFGFDLKLVDIGPANPHADESDGTERATSRVVVHRGRVETSTRAKKGRVLGTHPTNFLAAVRSAFAEQPVTASPFTDAPAFVDESLVRDAFAKLYPIDAALDGADRKREVDRARTAYRDGRAKVVSTGQVLVEDVDGVARIRFAEAGPP